MSDGKSIQLVTVGLVFSTICLPIIAGEQSITKAKIPFSFAVGRAKLPAGDYEIRAMRANRGEMMIRSTGGKLSCLFPAEPIKRVNRSRLGYLVFRSTKNGRFLSQIWTRGSRIGRHIPAALVESDQTPEEFRRQANRPAQGTGGKA